MFVRTLIGRNAGSIVEMPYHIAEAAKLNGTAQAVSEQELAEAKVAVAKAPVLAPADSIPEGYKIEPDPVSGFNVLDADDLVLTHHVLLKNMPAAREFARTHAAGLAAQKKPSAPVGRPVGGSKAEAEAVKAKAS